MSEKRYLYPSKESYPIDAKSEPLLASLKRLKLMPDAEEKEIIGYNPKRQDQPVCRLDKKGESEKVDKIPASQVRMAYAICAAAEAEADGKLDAAAKKELRDAMDKYLIHTTDASGNITKSRVGKNDAEILNQANADADGAHHFRMLLQKAFEKGGGKIEIPSDDKKDRPDDGKDSSDMSSLNINLRELESLRVAGTQLARSMDDASMAAGAGGTVPYKGVLTGASKVKLG